MTEHVYFSWTCTAVPEEIAGALQELVKKHGGDHYRRSLELKADDPDATKMEHLLRLAGLKPSVGGSRQSDDEYYTNRSRQWDLADLDGAEFLWLRVQTPRISIFVEDNDHRCFCAEHKELPKAKWCLGGNGLLAFCPEEVEELLIQEEFDHLQLRPLKVKRRIRGHPYFVVVENARRWWQLMSDLTLPPFAPSIRKQRLTDGAVVDRHDAGNVECTEPPYRELQPAYLKSEWMSVPHFDVAMSFEHRLMPSDLIRWLIVSKRFYEFCKKVGLKADWVPVRFEEG